MSDPLSTIGFFAGFAFALGVLIFIHESGHYMVAKALGIRVEVFSLGFGPKLVKIPWKGTEYCISAIPLGGYVKMLGEEPDESLRGSKEEFQSRSKLARFLVLVMGATLNIVLAVVLTSGIYLHGVPEPVYLTEPAVIGYLDPNAPASSAGILPGDTIVSIGGETVATWRDMQINIALNPTQTLDFEIERDGAARTIPITIGMTERDRIGRIGVGPYTPVLLTGVVEGGPAAEAGIHDGDVLKKLQGEELFGSSVPLSQEDLEPGKEILVQVERDGTLLDFAIVLTGTAKNVEDGMDLTVATRMRKYGPVEALSQSLKDSWEQAGILFLTLKKLFSGQLSPRTLSGPIEIFRLTSESLRSGWIQYIGMMALISLQLGIINLLPIPILDGGHIFILLVEGVMRRDLSLKLKERVMQFGFIMLLLLMGSVIFLDLSKNWPAIKDMLTW